MCRMLTTLQSLTRRHDSEENWNAMLDEARDHMHIVCELYQWQCEEGRLDLHEHPDRATSWHEDCLPGVRRVRTDMCRFGMIANDIDGAKQLVVKPNG